MKVIYIIVACLLITGCIQNKVLFEPTNFYYSPNEMISNYYIPAKQGADIYLYEIVATGANSAGGRDVHIVWQNSSNKIIKYIYFTVTPINKVGDPITSEINRQSSHMLKSTGPYKPWFPIVLSQYSKTIDKYYWNIYTGKAENTKDAIFDIVHNHQVLTVSYTEQQWGNVWYSYEFVKEIKVKVSIEYMDGTKVNNAKIYYVPKVTNKPKSLNFSQIK